MGSEAENGSSYTSKLPLFSSPHAHMESAERSEMLTPPLHASVSVPFRWEEEPGKPKPCSTTTLAAFSTDGLARKCLELPPRLFIDANKNTKLLPSPTTVLEGPYMSRARFQSSSFRMGSECYGSFRGLSPENMVVQEHGDGDMAVGKRVIDKEKGFVGSGRRREVGGNSYVFPSFGDQKGEEYSSSTRVNITRTRRIRSSRTLSNSKSHFWASIYEGLKQVVPWSKRDKKEADYLIHPTVQRITRRQQ